MKQPKNLREFVDYIGLVYGAKTALQLQGETGYQKISYLKLAELVRQTAGFLKKLGFEKGDRAAVLSENRPEWGIAYLAIIYAGGIVVPLDPALKAEELAYLVNDSKCTYLFTSEKYSASADYLKNNCPSIKSEINFDRPADDPKSFSWSGLVKQAAAELPDTKIAADDTAVIVYTSGTTGNPKGVMLTHGNLIFETAAMVKTININQKDRTLSVLPLHHTFECTTDFLLVLSVGAEVTYIQSLKSSKIFEAMEATRTTIFIAVPLLFQLIYNGIFTEIKNSPAHIKILFKMFWILAGIWPFKYFKKKFFGKLHKKFGGAIRFFVTGGAGIDQAILAGFRRLGFEMVQGYGLTEASPVVTDNRLEKNILGSIGAPLPGVEVKINNPDKHGIGELLVKGPNVMKGYYQRPDLTAEVLQDGWLYTGDLARQDAAGYFYISGRIKDIIVSPSGQNVYPDEIEMVLARNSEIAEICVFGNVIESGLKKGAEEVTAIIRPDDKNQNAGLKIKEIIDNYNKNCATFKRIENYQLVYEELPKTSTRKIKRNLIKKIWRDLK